MTQTSRAVRIHAHGGPEQLVIDTWRSASPALARSASATTPSA
jgi:hypothetical protein